MKSWLDYAMMKYGGSYLDTDVEEVKTIARVMLIFATLVPYWTCLLYTSPSPRDA